MNQRNTSHTRTTSNTGGASERRFATQRMARRRGPSGLGSTINQMMISYSISDLPNGYISPGSGQSPSKTSVDKPRHPSIRTAGHWLAMQGGKTADPPGPSQAALLQGASRPGSAWSPAPSQWAVRERRSTDCWSACATSAQLLARPGRPRPDRTVLFCQRTSGIPALRPGISAITAACTSCRGASLLRRHRQRPSRAEEARLRPPWPRPCLGMGHWARRWRISREQLSPGDHHPSAGG